MNNLQIADITNIGYNNGFEYVESATPEKVVLASARHSMKVAVAGYQNVFSIVSQHFTPSFQAKLQGYTYNAAKQAYQVHGSQQLAQFLHACSRLALYAMSSLVDEYRAAVKYQLGDAATAPTVTEAERLVMQRIGQEKYRTALLRFWNNACAVTGVTIPEVLRASHIKPWAECTSDEERLDVYNGFLLTANLDALFDRFLISFDSQGYIIFEPSLNPTELAQLGIHPQMKLRQITPQHERYLVEHRERVFDSNIEECKA